MLLLVVVVADVVGVRAAGAFVCGVVVVVRLVRFLC